MQSECDAKIGKGSVAILIADTRTMAPAASAFGIFGQRRLRIAYRKLISDKFDDAPGHFCRALQKGAQKPDRAKLDCDAKTVVITAMFGNESAVPVIKVKIPVQLIGCWVSSKATIVLHLPVAEKTDRHCNYRLASVCVRGALRCSRSAVAAGRAAPLAST